MNHVEFFIPGKPKSYQALQFNRRTGSMYRTKEYKRRVNEIGFAASDHILKNDLPRTFFAEWDRLTLSADFVFPYTTEHYRVEEGIKVLKDTLPYWYSKKVDIDNMLKSLKDGMINIIYPDDSQIVSYQNIHKIYGRIPGIRVTVRRI